MDDKTRRWLSPLIAITMLWAGAVNVYIGLGFFNGFQPGNFISGLVVIGVGIWFWRSERRARR